MRHFARGATRAAVLLAGLAGAGDPSVAQAQTFPARPVRVIVPFGPGGSSDIVARLVSQEAGGRFGQTLVVENRPGGSTQIGTEVVANAEPDGYTILLGTSSLVLAAVLDPKTPIQAQRDFTGLVNVASAPFIMVVNAELPIRNLGELVAYAKANPQQATYGTSGAGSPANIAGELLNLRAGVKLVHALYKSELNGVTDVMGKHLLMTPASYGALAGNLASGKLRPVAVTSRGRMKVLGNVPTVGESGYPGFYVEFWNGLFAPKKTPQAIVDRLSAVLVEAVRAPQVTARLEELGYHVEATPSAVFDKGLEAEARRWADLIRQTGVSVARQ